eukprot:NODE_2009_length_520_cov_690.734607_g1639_i0.p1 GENE.NODE_2009_length_520_cov_690.734607_g1639_i0~~NODE_2009_length_520_cov_690.734607_g1639_i0.p1  ORF type:complete len:81 (+),score=31.03 NODE_2009_length_520_cov_690.734607_g1639_i0:32-244(+)
MGKKNAKDIMLESIGADVATAMSERDRLEGFEEEEFAARRLEELDSRIRANEGRMDALEQEKAAICSKTH